MIKTVFALDWYYRDPPIPYTLSPLTKGGKGWVRGDSAQPDSIFCA